MANRSRSSPTGPISVAGVLLLAVATTATYFGAMIFLGQGAAGFSAVLVGGIGGLVVYSWRPAPKKEPIPASSAVVNGCRFIALDADDIACSLRDEKREVAEPGAIPPRLASAPTRAGASTIAAPWSTGARPASSGLRLAHSGTSAGRSWSQPENGGTAKVAPLPAAAPDAASAEGADTGSPMEESKSCPKCGVDLVPRLSMEGPMAGKLVWRCREFPKCDYVRSPGREAHPALHLKST